MEIQNTINLLNDSNKEEPKFATKKKKKKDMLQTVKLQKINTTKTIICDYSDAFISVTGDIKVTANNDTHFAFENRALFSTCKTEINDTFIDEASHNYISYVEAYVQFD